MKHRSISLAGPGGPSDQDVQLDVERLAGTRLLVQGGSGSGKSYLLRRLIEQFALLKMQVIVIDPEGEFNTIREKFPFVLCGPGGETAARVDTADIFAHKLLKLGASAICDLYELAPQDRQEWVGAFLTAMVNAPKNLWREVVFIIDEAHMFCPESGSSPAKDAMIALNSRGRKRGFIPIWGTQRLAKIDKDAAAELQNVLIGLTFIDVDLKRAIDVLGIERDYAKAERRNLRTLKTGYFYAFGVALSKTVQIVPIGPAMTTHPKITGQRRRKASTIKTPTQIKAFLKELNDLPKEAAEKRSTEEHLRAEIAALKDRLRTSAPSAPPQPAPDRKDVARLRARNVKLSTTLSAALRVVREVGNLSAKAKRVLKGDLGDVSPETVAVPMPAFEGGNRGGGKSLKLDRSLARQSAPVAAPGTQSPTGSIAPGERKILKAVGQFGAVDRGQLTVLVGYRSSARDTYISRLSKRGLVEVAKGLVRITEGGVAALGGDYKPLPSGPALLDYWRGHLPPGERKVMESVVGAYPGRVTREQISHDTGYKSSARDTYISRLTSRRVVESDNRGSVIASNLLFDAYKDGRG